MKKSINSRRIIILAVALVLTAVDLFARSITPEQAADRISAVLAAKNQSGLSAKSLERPLYVASGEALTPAGDPSFYVFERNGLGGYIIASADDRLRPVLAVVDSGSFNSDSIPEPMRCWIDGFTEEARAIAVSPVLPRSRGAGSDLADLYDSWSPVNPLLTTKWSQTEPYSNDCPMINGKRCVTGCIATALAQIIHHNRYFKGYGSHTYTLPGINRRLTYMYENHIFDWDNMIDDYDDPTVTPTPEQKAAVADLMYACGVLCDMNYGTDTSGSVLHVARLVSKFGMDPSSSYFERSSYSTPEWEAMIYEELSNGRPVYYSGYGNSGGHAFVCDGYADPGLYHINWGWGGSGNGYFALSALYSGGQEEFENGFTGGQAIARIIPPTASVKPEPLPDIIGRASSYSFNNIEDYSFWISFERTPYETTKVRPGLLYTSVDNRSKSYFVPIYKGNYSFDYNIGYSWKMHNLPLVWLGIYLPAGRYTVDPAVRIMNEGASEEPVLLRHDNIIQVYADVDTRNNISYRTVSTSHNCNLSYPEINIPSDVYADTSFPVDITAVNTGDLDFQGNIKIHIGTNSGQWLVYEIAKAQLMIPLGDSYSVRVRVKLSDLNYRVDLNPGSYRVLITADKNRNTYYKEGEIIVHSGADPAGDSNPPHLNEFYIAGMGYGFTPGNMEFTGFPSELPNSTVVLQPWEMSSAAGSYSYGLQLFRPGESEPCYYSPCTWSVSVTQPNYYLGKEQVIDNLPCGRFLARFVSSDGCVLSDTWSLTVYREVSLASGAVARIVDEADNTCSILSVVGHGPLLDLSHLQSESSSVNIGPRLFDSDIDLEQLVLPSTLNTIGVGAFRHCRNLKSILFSSSGINIAHPDAMFYGAGQDLDFYVPEAAVEEYRKNLSGVGHIYAAVESLNLPCDTVMLEQGTTLDFPIAVPSSADTRFGMTVSDPSVASVSFTGSAIRLDTHNPGWAVITVTHPQPGFVPATLYVRSFDPSAIDEVPLDSISGNIRIYNLSGVLVGRSQEDLSRLSSGIYIVRTSSVTSKITIR